jgi:hypothetical protein
MIVLTTVKIKPMPAEAVMPPATLRKVGTKLPSMASSVTTSRDEGFTTCAAFTGDLVLGISKLAKPSLSTMINICTSVTPELSAAFR